MTATSTITTNAATTISNYNNNALTSGSPISCATGSGCIGLELSRPGSPNLLESQQLPPTAAIVSVSIEPSTPLPQCTVLGSSQQQHAQFSFQPAQQPQQQQLGVVNGN